MKSVLVIVNTSVVKDKLGRLGSNINSTPLVVVDTITIKLEHYIVQIQPTSQNTMITKSQSNKQSVSRGSSQGLCISIVLILIGLILLRLSILYLVYVIHI